MTRPKRHRPPQQPGPDVHQGGRGPGTALLILALLALLNYAAHHPVLLAILLGVPIIALVIFVVVTWRQAPTSPSPEAASPPRRPKEEVTEQEW